MSTPCIINFAHGKDIFAKIYRHWDGYPDTVKADLQKFFFDVENQTEDTRFNDASYLAAKFVVWQAGQYNDSSKNLDFLGIGIVMEDNGIDLIYTVDCGKMTKNHRPTVSHNHV